TNPAKDAGQVIGYSHSTKPASGQVAGYPPQAGNPHPNPLPEGEGSIALSPSGGKLDRGLGTNDRCASLSFFLADENETIALARRVAAHLKPGMVIYLHGDLGAGKTTLVRGVLGALGYPGRVKSPTYTLVEPYHVAGLDLRHFDLYRLHDEQEWESAGFRDEFDRHNIFLIEWPEKARNFIPRADVEIDFEILPQGRQAGIHANTEMGKQCLEQL
ncbi:MAG: tRNA (adenosine(37)-N6)-threonylcarbamoyltransferase complex ATPase subunit type 1 TsaE, partial [Gallionella sp.]